VAIRNFTSLNPDFVPRDDWKESYFASILSNRDMVLNWITADGGRAGFVLFGVEPHRFLPRRTGAVYELFVEADHRGRGIGEAAAEAAIRALHAAGVSKIQLEVMVGNEGAARLWRKLGFARVAERYVLAQGS
jgi:ribosomal protein S18 acetylase RimI-like enzyme